MPAIKILIPLLSLLIATLVSCHENKNPIAGNEVAAPVDQVGEQQFVDLSGVTDIKKLLCQNWEHKEDAEDAEAAGAGGSMEVPYRGVAFFEDGTVTENPRDKMRLGKWIFNDATKLLDITFDNGSSAHYKIGAIGPRRLILLNKDDRKTTTYRSDGKMSLLPQMNPFHPSNNKWRVPPRREESASALKQRTVAAVDFYAKFLSDNAAREGNIISFIGLPTCFKWYNGGISIVKKETLEQKWIKCFYSSKQAGEAQEMLESIISKKYKWNKNETNWVKQSADVLQQLSDTLNRF